MPIEFPTTTKWFERELFHCPEPLVWIPVRSATASAASPFNPVHFFWDSGADVTIIPTAILDANGIEWNTNQRRPFAAPWGPTEGFLNLLVLSVCDTTVQIPYLAYRPQKHREVTLLGRAEVVDQLEILMRDGMIKIEPR